jgi:hypothetical protein
MNEQTLIFAESSFPPPRKPTIPDFSVDDLRELGVSVAESDGTRVVEIPVSAQKKLIEVIQPFGFGGMQAVQLLINRILSLAGFTGTYNMAVDPQTFCWRAWQPKEKASTEESQWS